MGPETHRLSVNNILNLARSPDKVVVFERRDRSADLADVNSRDLQIRLIDGVEAHNSLPEIGWCDPWFKNHQTPPPLEYATPRFYLPFSPAALTSPCPCPAITT